MSKARELSVVPQSPPAFSGTALLVFTHNVTGLKYFCKTTKLNSLNTYNGSGVYWKKHLNKHGKDISRGVVGIYYDKARCVKAALEFSKEHNIDTSKEWANLIPENGLDGAPTGENHPAYGKPSKCIGQKRPQTSEKVKGSLNGMWGKVSPLRGIPKPKGKDSPLFGRKRPEGGGKPSKPVIREDGKMYTSISEAATEMNGARSSIAAACNQNKQAYGYAWSYVNV